MAEEQNNENNNTTLPAAGENNTSTTPTGAEGQGVDQKFTPPADGAEGNNQSDQGDKPPVGDPPKVTDDDDAWLDKRLYTEDGKFNKEGAKQYYDEVKAEKDNYEKRILDLRRTVSKGKAPEKKEEYFQDYAPPEKFTKFFAPNAENAKDMKAITDTFSDVYHNIGLNKEQANAMSNAFCGLMEGLGVFDTRTESDKYAQAQKFVQDQKSKLGVDADQIIREAKTFVENVPVLNPEEKNVMRELMDRRGAGFVSLVHKLKDMYGGPSSDIPLDMTALGSLPSDVELKAEYLNKETSDVRRQEITKLRARAGRKTRLMAATL